MEKARFNRYMSDLETSKISLQSKFDQTSKISKSVFISNFPDDCTSRDLWNVCNHYGTVVDVFIPNKKSKAGRRFAFVRFIKVLNFDRLIENLKTIWIGRFHLYANPARFDRPKALTFQKVKPVSFGNVTGFRQPNVQYHGGSNMTISTPPFLLKPTLVLDNSCLVNRDIVNCVMGEVLQFSSINNLWEVRTTDTTTNIPYPPGFTPVNEIPASINQDAPELESDRPPNRSERSNSRVLEEVANSVDKSSSESINNGIKLKEGGSILEILEEMITVGQTMRFSMEGCTKDMEKIIGTQGEQIPNKQKLLLISVYAPQSVSSKRMLWSYLASLITSWNGESLIMGDFNEVRCIEERWGSVFNVHGANGFNSFISNSDLNDIQLK
nr:RNA-directed DNA polymerase, eukaryota, nucleotide-binding alpha-beta plait domain protein [Tanacetum cinerariifolium]